MQRVSSLYQTEVQKPFAGQALLRITFGLIDTDAAATCAPAVVSAAQTAWSRPDSVLLENGVPHTTYATFEPGRMRLDGRQRILPIAPETQRTEGLVSAKLSGADGLFSVDDVPVLRLRFSKTHTVPGLTLTFDASTGDHAGAVRVVARGRGEVLLDKTYTPKATELRTNDAVEHFDEIDLHFLSTVPPKRRLRLQKILFGFGLVFGNAQVQSAAQKMDVDPITRRLPLNTFHFSIVNVNTVAGGAVGQYVYDPDNLAGVYRYISEQSPVHVEYGQMLSGGLSWADANCNTWAELERNGWKEGHEGGVVEWVNGGRYYLTAQPTVDGLSATFKAQDVLSRLNMVYPKGEYHAGGQTLYALAEAVLQEARLPRLVGDSVPWRLWEGLREVTSTAPLPTKKSKELLQLIAHAGRCVLYTDRTGYICIEPANAVQDNYRLDFHTLKSRPKVSQTPTLRAVECAAYCYTPSETVTTVYEKTHLFATGDTKAVVAKTDGAYNSAQDEQSRESRVATQSAPAQLLLQLTFSLSVEHKVVVQGARVVSCALYAGAAEIVLAAETGADALYDAETGKRAVKLIIRGRKLETAASTVTVEVPAVAQPDENGSVESLSNPLITSETNAASVATWVRDYLMLRNTYDFLYRGSPELECGDLVELETQFAPYFASARVLKSELSFDGSLSGKITAKRMVNP